LRARLWLDASRRAAGVYLVERAALVAIEEKDAAERPGRDRHALLLVRKHLDGRRLAALDRVPGHRLLVFDFDGPKLALRIAGTPALSVVIDGAAAGSFGEGSPAWPLPEPRPDTTEPGSLVPRLRLPAPLGTASDADLAPAAAVRFAADAEDAGGALETASWREAGEIYLVARRRGARFEAAQRRAQQEAAREVRRLARLLAHLDGDLSGLPEAELLRRQGEAILASPRSVPRGSDTADVPDPREDGRTLQVSLDPRLDAHANAERLFARARRIERARSQVALRRRETASELEEARSAEARAASARELRDLVARARDESRDEPADGKGPRHFLTSRGLSLLVGRGARENHHLTFSVARPDDLWLHARDVPGSHVVLRDPEGRAAADDLREAAEVAAFYSEARAEARVDVHVTRRKHVRPAKGGPGRVHVFHSDTMRVTPRDPSGRLRRRP
jgi:predicted ribosome quality control (RQC) complex YloA/Tae2 family protein